MKKVLFIFFLASNTLNAQQLTGKVIDKTTNEPLAFATVYFSQTLIGTTSDLNGNFRLDDIEPGKYNLIATYVGYRTLPVDLTIEDNETYEISLYMVPDTVKLDVVEIVASSENRKFHLETFRKLFLGYSPEALQCTILNEGDLYFKQDGEFLYAYTDRPIEVKNKELGYILYYELYDFQYNFQTRYLRLFGVPRFEEVKKKPKRKWEKARNRSYQGSLLHFFNAITEEGTSQTAFTIKSLNRIPNPKRLPDSVLIQKMEYYRKKNLNEDYEDSIRVLKNNYQRPRYIDIEGKTLSVNSILKEENGKYILKGGAYYIRHNTDLIEPQSKYYLEEKEDNTTSKLFILDKNLKIYPNGYVEDASRIYIEGYWGWSEKVGNMLPLTYSPDD